MLDSPAFFSVMVGRKPADPGRLKKSNGTTNEVASRVYQ